MRILYLSLSYLPSRRASSVQVMLMCNAFAKRGDDVTLFAKREEPTTGSLHDIYGVDDTFAIELGSRPAGRGGGMVYVGAIARELLRRRRTVDVVYSRDLVGSVIATGLGLPVVFEAHGLPDRSWHVPLWRRMVRSPSFLGLVAISHALERELAAAELLPLRRPVVVAHSPAEPRSYAPSRNVIAAPARIGYVGNLYPGRGVELIVEVARVMPDHTFVLVGGSEEDLATWRASSLPANITMRGYVAPRDLPAVYGELDVLLMPYPRSEILGPTRRLDTSKYCSPMKMFEYMASGVAMVSSDLPVLQEVLRDDHNALIAPAGDVRAWQRAIDRLVCDDALRSRIAQQARTDVQGYTSDVRAARIVDALRLDQRFAKT
ncbi:MAG: glycosyltransferase family 4 protein [Myxococcota bacterium]|nr:glycosyltransferase family 4 protein [Myxococcota bacterium]